MTPRALLAISLVAVHAAAQPSGLERGRPLVSRSEAAIVGVAAIGAFALIGSDQRIGSWARASDLQRNDGVRNVLTGARVFGDPGSVILGAALWGGGALAGDRATSTDGLRALEAVALAGAVTWLVKGATGRARPATNPADARDFRFGRGFGDRSDFQSFPSGHTTAAFAFAAAITARVAQRAPHRARWLGPVLYGAAALTGFSRVYDDRHWASDVVLGAGIGTASGLLVVRRRDANGRAR
ncbi:MAG TPA: phosphatase PAP2 family protein [Gemmatimonadaceae bacterium]|nr:phosphatase PAP2 family protein [Gemmatimonadaceae bacterium]